jgi:DNA repair protein RadA/Sms
VEGAPSSRAVAAVLPKIGAVTPSVPARPISQVDLDSAVARPTGVPELDRVLGGGIVPGAAMLLSGEPGVGKSTLLLEVAFQWANQLRGEPVLYASGEESAGQVRLRAERTGNVHERLFLASESELGALLGQVEAVKPGLLIVDSVQTFASAQLEGSAGGVTQVKAVAAALVGMAKETGIPVLLVGHVTKDGNIAGPRMLEHLVDVVLHFEGDRNSTLRLLRGVKNRFGSAEEVGCFEMHEEGIRGVADPSGLFRTEHAEPAPGSAISVVIEGKRPMLAEVQALVSPSHMPSPRRQVSGLDSARVAMILAVLEKRAKIYMSQKDVYAATVGGMKILEPSVDLAVAMAIASASLDVSVPPDMVVFGEVGLAGEVRRVPGIARRVAEAKRLGFKRAIVPPTDEKMPGGIKVHQVESIRRMLGYLPGARNNIPDMQESKDAVDFRNKPLKLRNLSIVDPDE